MTNVEDGIRELKGQLFKLLDAVAERLSLSYAIYQRGSDWAKLYRDAGHDSLCGFARRANPTSGRCRDEEAEMVRQALASGKVESRPCWQGTIRLVVPLSLKGQPMLAVALCGFGVDEKARKNDYLPREIAAALGLLEGADDPEARHRAFPGDSNLPTKVADVVSAVLVAAMRSIAEAVDARP